MDTLIQLLRKALLTETVDSWGLLLGSSRQGVFGYLRQEKHCAQNECQLYSLFNNQAPLCSVHYCNTCQAIQRGECDECEHRGNEKNRLDMRTNRTRGEHAEI